MRLFGRSKKSKDPSSEDRILQIKNTLEMLERKEHHLHTRIAAEEHTARTAVSINRATALHALKRKKIYEQQLEMTRGARFNLETQLMAIENATINLETLRAMRAGSEAMRQVHGEMDVGKVDAVVDDIRDQMDLAREISEAIAQPMGVDVMGGVDEEELMGELERMEQEEVDRVLLGHPAINAIGANANAVGVNTSASANAMGTSPGTGRTMDAFRNPAVTSTLDNKKTAVDEDEELKRLQESMLM